MTRAQRLTLGALLAVAAALRLYRLGEGLWLDEVLTLVTYARQPFAEIVTRYDDQNQHMLYSLLAHASFVTFGESAWALRLPAAIFGVASIYAAYLFCREIVSTTESLLVSALLTFSYHHIWFSQNARGYTALLFFTLLSSCFLLRGLRSKSTSNWLLYAATVALGMYSHLTMMFVVAGQFALFAFERARSWRSRQEVWVPLTIGFGLAVALTLALFAPVLPQLLGPGMSEETEVAIWRSPLWTLTEAIARLQIGTGFGAAILLGGVVLLSGFLSLVRRRPALAALFLGPVISGVGVTVAMHHALWPRFFFFAAGFALLVLVRSLFVLAEAGGRLMAVSPLRSRTVAAGLVVLLIMASSAAVMRVYGPKQDYLGARDLVSRSAADDEPVATAGLAGLVYGSYYAPQWPVVSNLTELRRQKPVWFVITMPLHFNERYPDMSEELRERFDRVKEFPGTLGGGEVLVYRARAPQRVEAR